MAKKDLVDYLFTDKSGNQYILELDKNVYDGVKSALGLTEVTTGTNTEKANRTSINDMVGQGDALRISCGLATSADGNVTARKIIVCPTQSDWKKLKGKSVKKYSTKTKTYESFTIRRVKVKTYVGYK